MTRPGLRQRAVRLAMLAWLVAVWMLLWGDVSWANLLSGLVLALLITFALPLPPVPVQSRVRPLGVLRLVGYLAVNLVVSSLQTAWLAIRPGPPPLTAVLRAQLAIRSDLMLALAVNIINLTPGTIVLEIDQVRRIVYIHVLDVGSQRAVAKFYAQVQQVERLVNAAFPPIEDAQSGALS
ncbi:Na+/H+ antiporter subunit E [Mycolicibacterium fallax]|uniref:Cation:proton antiporter n=1 Tax=Mycolicibacterium fallax TaxID=1793 RepID=A0A1X1RD19_MYCFA|nr:Na+/H+ antiporter subunit E [Mycolicibacterium fallax]ORV03173.1 cation:proton antiporter [Mycolicibacterium fallax]BBY98825.1 Na+/H+ antiporter subunit E [Mycolicibacterium fallax]HOW94306.1 Na+/H+ antiporter subunit E [Mycolicibacterium fallax]HSA40824.1 Na+/H+ antiporter subunit E [Mycobacterium sp.]